MSTTLAYDWAIVLYFFLGGMSAGCFFVAVAGNTWKSELKPLARTAALAAPICVVIGMLILVLHLGRPLVGGLLMMVSFNPTSMVSWGTVFLGVFLVLSAVYALFVIKDRAAKVKLVGYAGLVFAVLVATYTAILLSQSPGRALWSSPLLPIMFLTGGLASGLALIMLIGSARGQHDVSGRLAKYVAVLVSAELVFAALEIVMLLNGDAAAVEAAKALVGGRFSAMFWGLQVVLGGAVPVVVLFRKSVPRAAQLVASCLVMLGVFAMRYVVVMAGQLVG